MTNKVNKKKKRELDNPFRLVWCNGGYQYQIYSLEGSDKFNLSIVEIKYKRDFPSQLQMILIPVSGLKMLIKYLSHYDSI